jgi:hypothetical protein
MTKHAQHLSISHGHAVSVIWKGCYHTNVSAAQLA